MTLLMGTCMLYSTRTSMPLVLPAVSSEFRWSKTESGTVLSSFFWGYTITQVRHAIFFGHRIFTASKLLLPKSKKNHQIYLMPNEFRFAGVGWIF